MDENQGGPPIMDAYVFLPLVQRGTNPEPGRVEIVDIYYDGVVP